MDVHWDLCEVALRSLVYRCCMLRCQMAGLLRYAGLSVEACRICRTVLTSAHDGMLFATCRVFCRGISEGCGTRQQLRPMSASVWRVKPLVVRWQRRCSAGRTDCTIGRSSSGHYGSYLPSRTLCFHIWYPHSLSRTAARWHTLWTAMTRTSNTCHLCTNGGRHR